MNSTPNQDKLLTDLEEAFNKWKKKSGFNASLRELDEIFFVKDYILASGFVSPNISRMVCARIRDTFNGWIQQIHSWLLPSPYSIISASENELFNDEEKEEMNTVFRDFMSFASSNITIGLTKNLKKEAGYVDNSLKVWKKHLPVLIKFSIKVQEYWQSSPKNEK